MSRKTKIIAGITGGVLVLTAGAFILLRDRAEDIPLVSAIVPDEPPTCPLTGREVESEDLVGRPAVAVKIENASIAYPLSGLEKAELVYEELVEGGATRFMAIYHCTDTAKAGPVRSARIVDAAIMMPITHILAYSGENDHVMNALEEAGIVRLNEDAATGALTRIPREGLSSEHTLYGSTKPLRKLGAKEFDEPPPEDIFSFDEEVSGGRKATTVEIIFSGASIIRYEWNGDGWLRFQGEIPFAHEFGEQIEVKNVLVEEHEVNLSDTILDTAGNPSTEIANEVGSGRAMLFRDGRAIAGRWERDDVADPVTFTTRSGDEMTFAPGSIWIHLVPSDAGEVQGSFTYEK